jgi:hypothetical protein
LNKGKNMRQFLVAFLFVYASASPVFAVTTCTVDQKQSCDSGVGCQPTKNSIVVRIDWNQGSYSRCDAKGCDDLSMKTSSTGDLINIEVPEHAMLAKISKNTSSFIEVATIMETVLVSFGRCQTQ